jgi:D-glycerate 3-kinase
MRTPAYDKSKLSGRGDRADPVTWPSLEGPLDLVLLEG